MRHSLLSLPRPPLRTYGRTLRTSVTVGVASSIANDARHNENEITHLRQSPHLWRCGVMKHRLTSTTSSRRENSEILIAAVVSLSDDHPHLIYLIVFHRAGRVVRDSCFLRLVLSDTLRCIGVLSSKQSDIAPMTAQRCDPPVSISVLFGRFR